MDIWYTVNQFRPVANKRIVPWSPNLTGCHCWYSRGAQAAQIPRVQFYDSMQFWPCVKFKGVCVCVSHTLYQRALPVWCVFRDWCFWIEFYYVSRGLEYDSEVSNQRRRFWSHSDMILGRWNHVPATFHVTLWSTNVWVFRGFLVWTSCWCLLLSLNHVIALGFTVSNWF